MAEAFIAAGVDVGPADGDYSHFATMDPDLLAARWRTPAGEATLGRLREAAFDRGALQAVVGRIGGKYDLRAMPLRGERMRKADLSDCDLFRADLSGSDLSEANLEGSHLSEASIEGANASWIRVRATLVDNVRFDRRTKLVGVDVSGLNTNFALTLIDEIENQQRIAVLRHRHPWFAWLLSLTCDHGRSLGRWAICTTLALGGFALVFASLPKAFHGIDAPMDALYFSVVTFTTLGFGDVYPVTPIGKALVMAEVVAGYLMGGIFVAILTRRMLG